MFRTIKFRHNRECSEIIKKKFIDENNNSKLMPKEIIADIAEKIKFSNNISKQSIIDYANENNLNYSEITHKIKNHINIVDHPIYEVTSKEIEQYNKEQEQNKDFIAITSRLMYL